MLMRSVVAAMSIRGEISSIGERLEEEKRTEAKRTFLPKRSFGNCKGRKNEDEQQEGG